MILIRFASAETKRAAMSQLAGRFAFTSWATGEMLVPEDALASLAVQGIAFTVEGPAATGESRPTIPAVPDSLAVLLAGVTPDNLYGEWAAGSPVGGELP